MRRFLLEAIGWTLAAGIVWWWALAEGALWPTTVWLAKIVHRVAGTPAPYLLPELKSFYWQTPMFPPLVGLMLASRWLTWSTRLVRLAAGLAAFWLAVALQIALVYSPYLATTALRNYLERMSISTGYVLVPVVLWLILSGGPGLLRAGPRPWSARRRWDWSDARAGGPPLLALAFALLPTAAIAAAAQAGGAVWREKRPRVAVGIVRGDPALALREMQPLLEADPGNHGLVYLAAGLHRDLSAVEGKPEHVRTAEGLERVIRAERRWGVAE